MDHLTLNGERLIGEKFKIIPISHFTFISNRSIFALATPEELEESLKDWRKKIEDGTAQQFVDDVETVRKRIGQTTTIVAYKGL